MEYEKTNQAAEKQQTTPESTPFQYKAGSGMAMTPPPFQLKSGQPANPESQEAPPASEQVGKSDVTDPEPFQLKADGAGTESASELGAGEPMDSTTRGRMEGAFGTNFKEVQIHTGSEAVQMAADMNAHAFAVGNHVGFGAGEYNPGTMEGDALLAHELAHVSQQKSAAPVSVETLSKGGSDNSALEKDANRSALGVVGQLWGKTKQFFKGMGKKGMPALNSAVQFSRCSRDITNYSVSDIETADRATLDRIRGDEATMDQIQENTTAEEFARVTAHIMLIAPSDLVDHAAAKAEGLRILRAQCANKTVARRMIDANVEVVIVPRNKLMTDLPQFSSLRGRSTFDGRTWDPVRGSGGMRVGSKIYTAVTEENLLGGVCTAEFNGAPLNSSYAEGYSTTTHEFAHTLHHHGVSDTDRSTITDAYNARKTSAAAAPTDTDQWVDGREGCYASMTEHEFFAQLSNAYLGTNGGSDPYTGDARHNGKDWVRTHEPAVFAILEGMYGENQLDNTNPAVPSE